MKLYTHPISTTCRPIMLLAAEQGIALDMQVVDLFTGEHMQAPYGAVNPNHLIPVLEDGAFRLTESSAIMKYLADKAGSLDQDKVIAALDHARIAQGPGGPAAMVPGQHHVRMNMYLAQARSGRFQVIQDLGAMEPRERLVDGR